MHTSYLVTAIAVIDEAEESHAYRGRDPWNLEQLRKMRDCFIEAANGNHISRIEFVSLDGRPLTTTHTFDSIQPCSDTRGVVRDTRTSTYQGS